ncbi:MAG TPA: acetyltransferase [Clostridiales bacterium]|nr:acetyltransferase [Clostridiales bacterium]HHU17969.1 acetyltransferase [Clostridiales bacterium]
MKKIVLVGGGGHCKVIIDIIRSIAEYEITGITGKHNIGQGILGIPVIGDDEILKDLRNNGVDYAFICIGAIDNIQTREKIYYRLKEIGFKIPVLIHRHAIVSPYASIEEGTCVMPGAVVNPSAYIGKNCIINTSSVIEHDCVIEDNTHISPKSVLGGGVKVGKNSHIGIGSTIIQGIKIGNNVTIGAGAVVIDDIPDNSIAVGVPARVIKTKQL